MQDRLLLSFLCLKESTYYMAISLQFGTHPNCNLTRLGLHEDNAEKSPWRAMPPSMGCLHLCTRLNGFQGPFLFHWKQNGHPLLEQWVSRHVSYFMQNRFAYRAETWMSEFIYYYQGTNYISQLFSMSFVLANDSCGLLSKWILNFHCFQFRKGVSNRIICL